MNLSYIQEQTFTEEHIKTALSNYFKLFEVDNTCRLAIDENNLWKLLDIEDHKVKAAVLYILKVIESSVFIREGDTIMNTPYGFFNRIERFYLTSILETAITEIYKDRYVLNSPEDHHTLFSGSGKAESDFTNLKTNTAAELKLGSYFPKSEWPKYAHNAEEVLYVHYNSATIDKRAVLSNFRLYITFKGDVDIYGNQIWRVADHNFKTKLQEYLKEDNIRFLYNYWDIAGRDKIDCADYRAIGNIILTQQPALELIDEFIAILKEKK